MKKLLLFIFLIYFPFSVFAQNKVYDLLDDECTKKVKVIRTTKKIIRIKPTPENSISLFTGYGPSGTKAKKDVIFGVGYDKRINNNSNLRIIGISNGTVMGGIGMGF